MRSGSRTRNHEKLRKGRVNNRLETVTHDGDSFEYAPSGLYVN